MHLVAKGMGTERWEEHESDCAHDRQGRKSRSSGVGLSETSLALALCCFLSFFFLLVQVVELT